MELWATAQQELIKSNDLSRDYGSLAFDVLQKIGVTPIIQVNEKGKIVDYRNIEWSRVDDPDSLILYQALTRIKTENASIPIRYKDIVNQTLYYGDSPLLKKLRYYPLALLLIILLFGGVLYFFFQTNKVSEQNRLWAGMAKETAHQIGTPLSSLMGWITLLKEQQPKSESLAEMEKDINRLSIITQRFSKVGSLPELKKEDVVQCTRETIAYLKKRSTDRIDFQAELPSHSIEIPLNASLFSWTLENLVKNGIDAMKGQGTLMINIFSTRKNVHVEIQDQGNGIDSKNLHTIFSPGFTTKSRGWGLGLSLAKRIVEDYHHGKIHVKESSPGKGSTFEIILPRAD